MRATSARCVQSEEGGRPTVPPYRVVKGGANAGRLQWINFRSDGAARDLIVSPERSRQSTVSEPDGRWLAFRTSDSARSKIRIAPLATTEPAPAATWIELVAAERDTRPIGWSPTETPFTS